MRLIPLGKRAERYSSRGTFFYINPITGFEEGPFNSVNAREEHVRVRFLEPVECVHDWEELTRVACRADPGMVSGTQRCLRCGTTTHYTKDENE